MLGLLPYVCVNAYSCFVFQCILIFFAMIKFVYLSESAHAYRLHFIFWSEKKGKQTEENEENEKYIETYVIGIGLEKFGSISFV